LSPEDTCIGHVDFACLHEGVLHVVDWKFTHQNDFLPPIERHLQMLAYSLSIWRTLPENGIGEVQIHRVRCYSGHQDRLVLTPSQLVEIELLLAEVAESIRLADGQRYTGAQCISCLHRSVCPDRAKLAANIDTTAIAPYAGGEITSDTEALKFLLACPALEELLQQGKDAVRRWVETKGGPLVDELSNRCWGPHDTNGTRKVMDAGKCLEALSNLIGGNAGKTAAYKAMSTTIGAIEDQLKIAKFKPAEREKFMSGLFLDGHLSKGAPSKVFRWSQIRREIGRGSKGRG
jgi:hypothetical protein